MCTYCACVLTVWCQVQPGIPVLCHELRESSPLPTQADVRAWIQEIPRGQSALLWQLMHCQGSSAGTGLMCTPPSPLSHHHQLCQSERLCNRLKLEDLLISPVKHLAHYPLLLKARLKKTKMHSWEFLCATCSVHQ